MFRTLRARGLRPWEIALLFVALLAPCVYTVFDTSDGDLPVYHRYAGFLFSGTVPYRDWQCEYPPYALAWVVLPGIFPHYEAFRVAFSLQLLALDVGVKLVLLREGARLLPSSPLGRLTPFVLYSVGVIFQIYFYLKRLDAPAALIGVLALVAFARARFAMAGALLAFAVGTKLYPVLMAPALLYVAWRQRPGGAMRFVAGGVVALLPIALLSVVAPWWKFASFHAARGLQVESSYASILWLSHFFGLEADWASRPAWLDVDGPAARALLPVARVVFGAATIAATVVSVIAVRLRRELTPAFVARATLLPVIAFMAFNIVLSPQYAIWLVGPIALASTGGARAPIVVTGLAVVLTMFVFPAPGYFSAEGISLARTVILVARNLTLLVALALVGRDLFRREGSAAR